MKNRKQNLIQVVSLGQSGFRLQFDRTIVYIDPYLSNKVEKVEGPQAKRQVPIWKQPHLIDDADYVLVTHLHLDHCDIETVIPISQASQDCHFVGPREVCDYLRKQGIAEERLVYANNDWIVLNLGLRVHAVPAAHPTIECDARGDWRCVGYVIESQGRRFYHAGDTSLTSELIEVVCSFKPIDVAFLPVNEMNYYRNKLGIIGNMSIRDAFKFAEILEVKKMVPMHWDMFALNAVFQEEIELCYRLIKPPFEMLIRPISL